MSASKQRQGASANPLIVAHDLAQMGLLLPSTDNAERKALQAVHEAIVPWRLGQATEEDVRIKVVAIANTAFLHAPDLSRPESWILGAISSLLSACTMVELHSTVSAVSRGGAVPDLGHFVVMQIMRTFSTLIRTVPSSLPLGVTPALYRVVANDVGRRIDGMGEMAMRKTFGTGGPLQ